MKCLTDNNTQEEKKTLSLYLHKHGIQPLAMAIALGTALAVTTSTQAALEAVGPIDNGASGHGFPLWYRATDGMSLELCLDESAVNAASPQNPLCLLDRPELVDPSGTVVFPDNFWPEAFWTRVDSDTPTDTFVDPASGQSVNGSALLVTALEAAFANENAAPGENISFARIRIRIDNPVAGANLKVTHPFGVSTFSNVPMGNRAVNYTSDIGIPAVLPPPTDFTGALQGAIGPFLRWTDPDFPVLDQNGNAYIGDPAIAHTMTGSPFNTNFFRVEGPVGLGATGAANLCADPALGDDPTETTDCIETDLFIGSGKIARDEDKDGIPDITDNCTSVANSDQRDTDADGYGNICDADFNGDNTVNLSDYSQFRSVFGTTAPGVEPYTLSDHADFDGSGQVNLSDYSIFRSSFGGAPGPSCCGTSAP